MNGGGGKVGRGTTGGGCAIDPPLGLGFEFGGGESVTLQIPGTSSAEPNANTEKNRRRIW